MIISYPLILAVVATIVLLVVIQKGALAEHAWAGYLVIFVLWLVVLIQALGPRINLG